MKYVSSIEELNLQFNSAGKVLQELLVGFTPVKLEFATSEKCKWIRCIVRKDETGETSSEFGINCSNVKLPFEDGDTVPFAKIRKMRLGNPRKDNYFKAVLTY